MTPRTYNTPMAFKQALEQHLKNASVSGADFSRRRQLLVFDRFLARVVHVLGDSVILKGGLVLELRLERARTTKDVDLRLIGSPKSALEQLQEAGRLDLGDFMLFEVRPDPRHPDIRNEGMPYNGYRYRAEAKLAGKPFGQPFGVDVAFADAIAHVWFFFEQPVLANVARKMGCFLITETMAHRHQLHMESYDRLFPNQDTMPDGGFGNLIALPLQKEARELGNTVFLDGNLRPIPNEEQWSCLASIQRLAPPVVEGIANEALRQGKVIGIRLAEVYEEEDIEPWTRRPSRKTRPKRIEGPLPSRVQAVLAGRLFVEKAGLPSPLLNQIKRLAAFQNPEFYKRQNMRLSTAISPRVIFCFKDSPLHIELPRGCLRGLEALLEENGVSLEVDDKRVGGAKLDVTFSGTLLDLQQEAVTAMLEHDIGVFVAPPGIGKTVVGVNLIATRGVSTLVLVHRKPLLDQWRNQLAMFLGLDLKEIGQIRGGKRKPNGQLDVAMFQSLVRKDEVADIVADYGHVVVDECHHVPSVSFERVLSEVRARYITGLTATPKRRDGRHPISEMQLGPVRYNIDSKAQTAQQPFEHKLIIRDTTFHLHEEDLSIQEIYRRLTADAKRNDLILNDVIAALEEKRSPILLTERRDHLEFFEKNLRQFTRNLIVLRGGMKAKERKDAAKQFAEIPDDEERLIVATGKYIGEGFDDARLDTLFLALPISWKGTLIQYTGRLHRIHPGKTEVRIYDYVDRSVQELARMFERRMMGYRAIGYSTADEEPEKQRESNLEEPVIEWDEEALCSLDEDWM